MKKITVVTAVLCPSEETLVSLAKCMESVRKAVDRVHGEYVIVDDNSTVGQDYFKKLADVYIRNEKTEGVSVTLNRGMKATTGDFVVKLDSDYFVPENMFEVLLKDWQEDMCFISPSYIVSDYNDITQFELESLPIEGGVNHRPPGLAPSYLNPPSRYEWGGGILMFDRKKLADIDYFDEGFGIGGAQDNDVIYRLLDKGYNWAWDNNVVTRHFASISSRDKKSTQDWRSIRQQGVEYFTKKYGFAPGGFISKVYQKFNYKYDV